VRTIDTTSLVDLSAKLTSLRAALPAPLPIPTPVPIPIPPIPIHLSVVTTVMRGTTTIGYVITSFGGPAPSAANVTLASLDSGLAAWLSPKCSPARCSELYELANWRVSGR